jgi:transposase
MRFHQMEREERIAKVIENDEQPHPRDTKPHRRTLAHRSRKHGTSTLTIRGAQFIRPSGRYTFTITGVDHIFRTRRELPDNIVTMQFVELPERRRSANAPLKTRLYQLHVSIKCDDPEHANLEDATIDDHLGMDDGIRNHFAFSDGTRFSATELYPHRRPHLERRSIQGKPKNSKSRRHAELLHLTKNRKRSADKQRQTNAAVIEQLDTAQPAAVAVEGKQVSKLMRSARGRGRRRKAGLNRALADVTLGKNQRIVANQAQKRGIHIIPIPAPGTSQTCPRCGYRHRENRESQASFRCHQCEWRGNADHSAAIIIRNRGFVRTTERIHGYTPGTDIAPTGWQEQPSGPGQPALLHLAQSTPKPKRNATKPSRPHCGERPGSGAPGRTAQVLGTRVPHAGPMQPPDSEGQALETGPAQGAQTRLL